MRRAALVAIWGAMLATPRVADAHQSTTSYSRIDSTTAGRVDWRLLLSTRDLYEALALDTDRDATDAEVRAGEKLLTRYVLARVTVMSGAAPCPSASEGLRLDDATERRAELHLVATCPAPLAQLGIEYHLFFDLDPRHTGYAQITHGGRTISHEFKRDGGRFEWRLSESGPRGLGVTDFVADGVSHIFGGTDHIAFLVGLLLVAATHKRRAVPGGEEAWETRGLVPGIRYVIRVVTAFTVAHSITLIAAATGWLELPGRFVESAIAASIVYVAAENLWTGDPRERWPLAFGFGLVHGMGFATVLRPLLPPHDVVVPLLSFNVGVELGQLCIVAVIYPVLHVAATSHLGRYRRWGVAGGSAAIGLLGAVWLVERVLGLKIF